MSDELQSIILRFNDDMVYEHHSMDIPTVVQEVLSKQYPETWRGLRIPDEDFGPEKIENLKECVNKCCSILGNERCTGALFLDMAEKRIDIYGTQLFIGAVTGVGITLGISFFE